MDDKRKNNKNNALLIAGLGFIVFSIGLPIYGIFTNWWNHGVFTGWDDDWSSTILLSLALGIMTLLQFYVFSRRKNYIIRDRRKLSMFLMIVGALLIISSIILQIATVGTSDTTGRGYAQFVAMMLGLWLVIPGVILTGLGVYYAIIVKKHPEKEIHPVFSSVLIIGVGILIYLLCVYVVPRCSHGFFC